jgi:hypothetical protein
MYKLSHHSRFQSLALVLFAMLTLNFGAAFAQEKTSTTYRCTTKDAVSILQDGTLNKLVGQAVLPVFDKIVIDVSNGHITFPSSGKREEWTVEQTGLNENDYVLFRSFSRRIDKKTVANAVTNFIRLRATTSDPQPRFVAFVLSYLVTGTCAIVK